MHIAKVTRIGRVEQRGLYFVSYSRRWFGGGIKTTDKRSQATRFTGLAHAIAVCSELPAKYGIEMEDYAFQDPAI